MICPPLLFRTLPTVSSLMSAKALCEVNKIMKISAPPSKQPGNRSLECLNRLHMNIQSTRHPHSLSPSSSKSQLRTILILGDIVGGQEAGLALPQAGDDKQWLMDYSYDIQDTAEDGDEDFQDMIDEVKGRKDMRDVASFWKIKLGHK